MVDSTRRNERSGKHLCPGAAAECGLYAGTARRVGRAIWPACNAVDGGTRCMGNANGIGVGVEESPCRTRAITRIGVHVPLSVVARSSPRPVPAVARTAEVTDSCESRSDCEPGLWHVCHTKEDLPAPTWKLKS